MDLERFGMKTMVFMGRAVEIIGLLAIVERFWVDTSIAVAAITAGFYGGTLVGFGRALVWVGELGLRHHGSNRDS